MKHRQLPEWQHNLHVLWLNNFIIGMGFQLIMPFMALYIRQLGNFTRFQLNMWSGLVFAATFLVSSWMAPIWGKIADQRGRKLVMLISAAGMGTTMALMGTVGNVEELVLLRLLQGFFAGYVSNTSALLASMVPREQSGKTMSTLATGTTAGMLVGPLFGGVLADLFGYRATFFITGMAYALVFIRTVFSVHESNFQPVSREKMVGTRQLFGQLKYPHLIIGMFVTTLIIQAGNNSISPVISLYVQQLLHGHGNVNLVSGIVAALPGIATIFAAPVLGETGDRIGTHKILFGGLIFAFCVFLPQAFVHNVWEFGILRFLVGISDAALLPQVQTLLTKYSPAQFSGRIFSFNQAAQFMGNIFGPMIGSTISGTFGYAGVFVSTALLILVNLGWVRRSTRPLWHRETPAVK